MSAVSSATLTQRRRVKLQVTGLLMEGMEGMLLHFAAKVTKQAEITTPPSVLLRLSLASICAISGWPNSESAKCRNAAPCFTFRR